MPTHSITGSLLDALGVKRTRGEVIIRPAASHDSRVVGDDALLGAKVIAFESLPDPLVMEEGPLRITIQPVGTRRGGDPAFEPITTSLDFDQDYTWGEIVAGVVTNLPITPTLLQQAVDAAAAASADAASASASATLAAANAAAAATDASILDTRTSGVTGDGTNRASELQTALNALSTLGGGVALLPRGTVRINSQVTIPSNVTLAGHGEGATELLVGLTGGGSPVQLRSSGGSVPAKGSPTTTLTANATLGATTLTLASTTGLAAGDRILLGSATALIPGETNMYLGELVRIKSVDSGTQISIYGYVRDTYNTADGAAVWKPTWARGIGLRDLTIRNPSPNTTTTQVTSFEWVDGLRISNVEVAGADNPALGIVACNDVVVSGCRVTDSADSDASSRYGYGVMLSGPCEGVVVSDSHFTRVRHAFTSGGYTGHCGQPRRVTVADSTATETTSPSWDTHHAGRDITFANLVTTGSKSSPYQIRSDDTRIIGGVSTHCAGSLLVLGSATHTVVGAKIRGHVLRKIESYGMRASYAENVVVDGCEIDGTLYSNIDVPNPLTKLTVTRCRLWNAGKVGGYQHGITWSGGASATGNGHYICDNDFGNDATSTEAGLAAGGGRYCVDVGSGVTSGNYFADNRAFGMLTAKMINDASSVFTVSNNRQLNKVDPSSFPTGVATRVKAGTPVDGDFNLVMDGLLVADSSAGKLWVRVGATWKYVTLT